VTGSSGDSMGVSIFSTSAEFREFIVLSIESRYKKKPPAPAAPINIIAENTIISILYNAEVF